MSTCHHYYHRVLGGLDFLVCGEECLLEITGIAAYQPFTLRDSADDRYDVIARVRVVSALLERHESMQPILDGDDWWRMFSGADQYELRFQDRLTGAEYLLAQADRFTRAVSVYLRAPAAGAPEELPIVHDLLCNPLDQILVMNNLAYQKGMIVHSAGAVLNGSAFVFAGVSGAGKTTIARLLMTGAPDAVLLSDDRIIIRKTNDRYLAYGTPWPGEAAIAVNVCEQLRAVFFLTKANRPRIIHLSHADAVKRLFPVISCPWYDRERFPHLLDTCNDLTAEIPCFELQFSPEDITVKLLREFVRNEFG